MNPPDRRKCVVPQLAFVVMDAVRQAVRRIRTWVEVADCGRGCCTVPNPSGKVSLQEGKPGSVLAETWEVKLLATGKWKGCISERKKATEVAEVPHTTSSGQKQGKRIFDKSQRKFHV